MGIGDPNAKISTTRTPARTNITARPLTNQDAGIGTPGPKDHAQYGGNVVYMMILDPGTDIRRGDKVFIQEWGKHTIDSTVPYNVIAADPSGFADLELIRVPMAHDGNR